jgi:hypothetical protein
VDLPEGGLLNRHCDDGVFHVLRHPVLEHRLLAADFLQGQFARTAGPGPSRGGTDQLFGADALAQLMAAHQRRKHKCQERSARSDAAVTRGRATIPTSNPVFVASVPAAPRHWAACTKAR